MNFNFYIFSNFHGFDLYPNDKNSTLFQSFDDNSVEKSKMVITRRGHLIFYTFIQYGIFDTVNKGKEYIGLSLVFNSVYCSDIKRLYETFGDIFDHIIHYSNLIELNEQKQSVYSMNTFADSQDDIIKIKEHIRKEIESKYESYFQPIDNTFKLGETQGSPRKYSLYEGNNVLVAAMRDHNEIAVSPEYEVQHTTTLSKNKSIKITSLLFLLILLIIIGIYFINNAPINTGSNTDIISTIDEDYYSSGSIPTGAIHKCIVEITPDSINYFIVNVDSPSDWQVTKKVLDFDWTKSQVNPIKSNSEAEKLKKEIDALLTDIINYRKDIKSRLYFISYLEYKDNKRVNNIKNYLAKSKKINQFEYIKRNIYKYPYSINYLVNKATNEIVN